MRPDRILPAAVALLIALAAGPAPAQDPKPDPGDSLASATIARPVPVPGGEQIGGLFRAGPIYLAGQPSRAALEQLARDGVTVVVNLRTPAEMAAVPFDEPALLRSLGVDYVHIPIGPGEHAPRPRAVEQLNETLKSHRGKAVIHCASAFRSTQLWAAHLVKDRGVSPAQADEFAKAVTGAPAMVEQYLGRPSSPNNP